MMNFSLMCYYSSEWEADFWEQSWASAAFESKSWEREMGRRDWNSYCNFSVSLLL